MNKVQDIAMCLSLVLNFCSICVFGYGFYKYINKPRKDLESKVNELAVKVKEHDDSLKQGNDKFREQNKINKVIFNVNLAFIDFEIAYCHNTGYEDDEYLKRAKALLEECLTEKNL